MKEFKFRGDSLFLKTFKTYRDNFVLEIETGKDQYPLIKDIPELEEGKSYEITIKEIEQNV